MLFERLGGLCQGIKNGGSRTSLERNSHIFFFKWKATKFAIIMFTPMDPVVQSIHLQMENINALVYLVKMGAEGVFTHHKALMAISKEISDNLFTKEIKITAEFPLCTFKKEVNFPLQAAGD